MQFECLYMNEDGMGRKRGSIFLEFPLPPTPLYLLILRLRLTRSLSCGQALPWEKIAYLQKLEVNW